MFVPTAVKDQMDATMRPVEEEVQSAGRITRKKHQDSSRSSRFEMNLEKIHSLLTDSEQGEEPIISDDIRKLYCQEEAEHIAFLNSCMRKEVYIYIITPPPFANQNRTSSTSN